jgi:hypothetical protein
MFMVLKDGRNVHLLKIHTKVTMKSYFSGLNKSIVPWKYNNWSKNKMFCWAKFFYATCPILRINKRHFSSCVVYLRLVLTANGHTPKCWVFRLYFKKDNTTLRHQHFTAPREPFHLAITKYKLCIPINLGRFQHSWWIF